ncbi:MAG: tetratricopeptide (TPR) repeat protein [Planctomycetota bacterium]|jgi:tetratricopeptide (TPR) repeat protein
MVLESRGSWFGSNEVMIRILKRMRNHSRLGSLRRRAEVDPLPRSYVELCRAHLSHGNVSSALDAARVGLDKFPHSEDLRDLMRHSWRQTKSKEIDNLRRVLQETSESKPFGELIEIYLECEEYDEALVVAEELTRRRPDVPDGQAMMADILLRRFYKDHVASDAKRSIALLLRVLESEESNFQANFLLAQIYRYIGAISKSLFHLYRALDVEPEHEEARRLYDHLINLPLEKDGENELLRQVEENEASLISGNGAAKRKDGTISTTRKSALIQDLGRFSQLNSVTRAAFLSDEFVIIAKTGDCRELGNDEEDDLCEMARIFRSAAAISAKRMGIGAFQTSILSAGKKSLQFHAVGRTVLLVESDDPTRSDVIKQECVDFVASCMRISRELTHA